MINFDDFIVLVAVVAIVAFILLCIVGDMIESAKAETLKRLDLHAQSVDYHLKRLNHNVESIQIAQTYFKDTELCKFKGE